MLAFEQTNSKSHQKVDDVQSIPNLQVAQGALDEAGLGVALLAELKLEGSLLLSQQAQYLVRRGQQQLRVLAQTWV